MTAELGRHKMTDMMGYGEAGSAPPGPLSVRDLVEYGFVWSMGGVAGMPAKPLVDVKRGQTVVISMPNETSWPHAMHIHGHHFRQVSDGRRSITGTPWHDTILVERGETAEIAFVADNPGDWMIHCHMLEHQVSGMATWFRVT